VWVDAAKVVQPALAADPVEMGSVAVLETAERLAQEKKQATEEELDSTIKSIMGLYKIKSFGTGINSIVYEEDMKVPSELLQKELDARLKAAKKDVSEKSDAKQAAKKLFDAARKVSRSADADFIRVGMLLATFDDKSTTTAMAK